jgi:hypothetical protein
MEAITWFKHHFMVISLVWFPAFLGYMNGLIAFFKVWGLTKPAEFCGKLEDSLKAFMDAVKQSQPPKTGN